MERFGSDPRGEDRQREPRRQGLLRRLGSLIGNRKVSQVAIEAPQVPDEEAEPQARFSVSGHDRPAFVTSLTSDRITRVFDLVEKVSDPNFQEGD